ncbi:inactive TPR repeat-containing thioredoxin TTL3-like [Diospyros lotus]|uniref:inactive TPR repeat-containing thioredoxin TTL3-like n=1 Tax=Diospyros lotus TaxID=55363 RepID=UPI00224D3EC6|nr:inactive TPR repeat-containing thioredoxin TTL3-like [Diospyros lotus]
MSHSGTEMAADSLPDRFHGSCSLDDNKPDFRELDLASSLSPLPSRRRSDGGAAAANCGSSNTQYVKRPNGNASGEISGSDTARSATTIRNSKPGHRRSMSSGSPLIYSGWGSYHNSSSTTNSGGSTTNSGGASGGGGPSSVSSPNTVMYPTGNIFPSGKILKSNMGCRTSTRTDTLASGTGKYGHGNIIRGGGGGGSAKVELPSKYLSASDPEEVKKAGNDLYRRGNFVEALALYDRAISMSPENAAYRSNRAAALTMLRRVGEAVRECEEAVRLDPGYGRAHQRLASLYIRLGQVENARHHLCFQGQQSDKTELQKLLQLEKHLNRCADARKIGDWKSALRECEAAMVAGAESSPQLFACKAEAFLKLYQLESADSSLAGITKLEPYPASCSQTKFFGMSSEAYVLYVQSLVDMAFGRFENAIAAAEKAGKIDYGNMEVAMLLNNVKSVTRARSRGKDLFDSGRFAEACSAYGEGLQYDLSNSVLYCNRAVCWSKLGLWEQSVEDCNQALKIQPNYTKALLRRAASNSKLERWSEAARDYEVLRRELPGDSEVAESLLRAQVALKKSGQEEEEAPHAKCSGEVDEVSNLDRFKAAISSPGFSIVHFKAASNQQCQQISSFINSLSSQYPSIHFFKVDVEESPGIAKAEGVRTVPTFNIYKNGSKAREMVCPSRQALESMVRQYDSP